MAYFIIAVAIAVIVGPLLAVLPSKRQSQLVAFRDRARAEGFTVSLRVLVDIPPRLQRATDEPLVGYALRLTPREANHVHRDLYVRSRQGWEARSGDVPIPELGELPDSAEILFIGWDEMAVYWTERGGDEALNAVLGVLRKLHPAKQ